MPRALLACISLALAQAVVAQDWPRTKAEISEYRETSSHRDVIEFIESLQRLGAPFQVEYIGTSEMGRKIPLVILADRKIGGPSEARRSGKAIVYIQANIHGGEVEGKEATLQLMRDFALMLHVYRDPRMTPTPELFRLRRILDETIVLVAPIYNPDGNDDFGDGTRNRPSQDGPDTVGTRANGQGFDLNRDAIKAESKEMRAALQHIYTTWDPDVTMDLHTTNGTRHGYQFTYSPPLSPITEATIMKYSRDELLPRVRSGIRAEYGLELFDYGNAVQRGEKRRWETFGVEGRYVTTYVGLRNRIGILCEATSYLAFKDRISATYRFVLSVLHEIWKDRDKVVRLTRDADAAVVRMGNDAKSGANLQFGVRFEMQSRGVEEVLLEVAQPQNPVPRNKAPKEIETVSMEVFDRFGATRTARFPGGYFLPPDARDAVELLLRHGIVVERLVDSGEIEVAKFTVSEAAIATQAFQGRRLVRLEGESQTERLRVAPGWYYIDTAQPLGILAFHMLEPEGLDGLIGWGFLETPQAGQVAPIYKSFTWINFARERIKELIDETR